MWANCLGVLEDAQVTIAEIEVPEEDITQVKLGARVKLKTWALPTKSFAGKVTAIAPVGYRPEPGSGRTGADREGIPGNADHSGFGQGNSSSLGIS